VTADDAEISALRAHIDSMLGVVSTGRGQLRAHLLWELRRMMADMPPEKLTDSELAAAIAVLQAAHARAITPPTADRPLLRIVPKAISGLGTESP